MFNNKSILTFLGLCSPYRMGANASLAVSQTKKLEWKLIGFGAVLLAVATGAGLLSLYHHPLSPCLQLPARGFICLSMISSMSAFLVGPITAVRRLWKRDRRKELTDGIIEEVDNDEAAVLILSQHTIESLNYAGYWLRQKTTRISRQMGALFGEPTAALALLGLAGGLIKELGGLAWVDTTVAAGLAGGNYLNFAIFGLLVFCFGCSSGAIALKVNRDQYLYQLELIDATLKFKELSEQREISLH